MAYRFYNHFDVGGPNYRFLTMVELRRILGFPCTEMQVRGIFKTSEANGGYLCPGPSPNHPVASVSLYAQILGRLRATYKSEGSVSRRPLGVILNDIDMPMDEYSDRDNDYVRRIIRQYSEGRTRLMSDGEQVYIMHAMKLPERWERDLTARVLRVYRDVTTPVLLADVVYAVTGKLDNIKGNISVARAIESTGVARVEGREVLFPWTRKDRPSTVVLGSGVVGSATSELNSGG